MTERSGGRDAGARRDAIVERLADHLLAQGLEGASLRPMAKAVGTSDRMLLYYFEDKNTLIAAALGCIARRMTGLLDAQRPAERLSLERLRATLASMLLDDALWPYMRLWLGIAARAAHGDPLYREIGEAIGRGFLAWGAEQLDSESDAQRECEAAQLLIAIEGMVLLKSLGLGDVCERAY